LSNWDKREWVPAEPFARWLNERVTYWEQSSKDAALRKVLEEIGWTDYSVEAGLRRLFRMRYMRLESAHGRKKGVSRGVPFVGRVDQFRRSIVEDALHNAGVLFADLYPEIAAAEDVLLEPEAWCPGCRAEVTPVNGQCTFCDWRVGPKTGQVLQGRKLSGRVAA
jgi:hypothetical protein